MCLEMSPGPVTLGQRPATLPDPVRSLTGEPKSSLGFGDGHEQETGYITQLYL